MTSEISGELEPSNTPTAMPVKAPCPSESEKNAMRFETTMVERSPNMGVTSRTAMNALIIN